MRLSRAVARLAVPFSLLAPACDSDCEKPQRFDGHYAVWSNTTAHEPDPVDASYPSYGMFYNGWSDWNLTYQSAQQAFDLFIDGQRFSATYSSSDDDCNRFTMVFTGIYSAVYSADGDDGETVVSSVPCDITWTGDMFYLGDHLDAVWTYSGTWANSATGAEGSVTAAGEMTGTGIAGTFDTGFGE